MKCIDSDSLQQQHEELYRQIPGFKCKEGSTDCCGPIPFSKWEWDQVKDKRKAMSLNCPYSEKGYCEIYEQRPLLCRLFGAVEHENLTCPHGCRPVFKISSRQAEEIMAEYQRFMEVE